MDLLKKQIIITEKENKIPSVNRLATTPLTAVENKITDVGNLVKKKPNRLSRKNIRY